MQEEKPERSNQVAQEDDFPVQEDVLFKNLLELENLMEPVKYSEFLHEVINILEKT